MKKNKLMCSIFWLLFVVSILMSGCSKTVYGISSGTYTMQGAPDKIIQPYITFDAVEKTFSFSYDVLSSYYPSGTWDFEKEQVVATTYDSKYIYVFEVVDNDTIRFKQIGSSHIVEIDGSAPISDGTLFQFTDK